MGDSGGWRSLVCCSARGCKELDMTEQLNNDNNVISYGILKKLGLVFHPFNDCDLFLIISLTMILIF